MYFIRTLLYPNLFIIANPDKNEIVTVIKPLISNNILFIVSKDNLLVCIDLNNGKIIYSIDISLEVANFLNEKKKSIYIQSLSMLNNNLFIFLDNSYYIIFNANGKIQDVKKLPEKLGTFPIFINESIIYLNNKNKLVIVD